MDIPLEWYTEQGREIPGPSWSTQEMGDWDEDDRDAMRAAMDASLHDRLRELEQENERLRDRLVTWKADYMEED